MPRTRRAAIDGGFDASGSDWYDSGSFVNFGAEGFATFSLPFSIYLGGNFIPDGLNEVSTVTLWDNGVLSLGPVTQAQIDFMASGASPVAGDGNPGFPGFFFLIDHAPDAQYTSYSYGLGVADYDAPFDDADAVAAAFFSFDNGFQIILDQNGFSVVTEFGGAVINGFYIGGLSDTVVGGQMDYSFYPNFLRYVGTADAETVTGSDYHETFISSGGADTIDGGGGIDVVAYTTSLSGVTVNLATGVGTGGDAEGDQLIGIEQLAGSQSSDRLTGSAESNRLSGLAGIDTISGGAGDDLISGGAGGDTLNGGTGIDTLSYVGSSSGVTVSLADGTARGGDATGDFFRSFEAVEGSDLDDVLEAAAAGSRLMGHFGEDTLLGGAGADTLSGGFDDDYLAGGGGGDLIDGGAGTDTASYAASAAAVFIDLTLGSASGGEAEGDTLVAIENLIGTAFADTLIGGFADNRLVGGAGTDFLNGGLGNDTLLGGGQNDLLDGGAGGDVLVGGAGFDVLMAGAGADILTGDAGDDMLDGGSGADTMSGNTGNDSYVVDNAGDNIVELADEGLDHVTASVSHRLSADVENLTLTGTAQRGEGNQRDNALTGNLAANLLRGNAGNDTIDGGEGDDTLDGGTGADVLLGGAGNDIYLADGEDTITELAGEGEDELHSHADATLGANIEVLRLLSGAANGTGNALGNRLFADAQTAATLRGMDGNDDLYGSRLNDFLDGNVGNDRLFGNSGNDQMFGRNGDDLLEGQNGADALDGGAGNDVLLGGLGDDVLTGGDGADRLRGEDNEDVLNGDAGIDTLLGEAGNDQLFGGADGDRLTGGAGRDRMTGGTGGDVFIFAALSDFAGLTAAEADRVLDFSQAEGDTLRLDALDANSTLGGNQAFAFVGTAAFSGAAGELRYEQVGGITMIYADTDGNGAADFAIRLDGLVNLAAGDFVL